MSTVDPEVLRKVRAFLKRAKSDHSHDAGAAEGVGREAALAMEMANRLLTEHNLTLADIPEEQIKADCAHQTCSSGANKMYGHTWVREVAPSVAHLCFCKVLYAGTYRIMFVGAPTEAAVAVELWDWITEQMRHYATQARKRNCIWVPGTSRYKKYTSDWMKGCAIKVDYRLRELYQARQDEIARTNPTNAIVRVTDERNQNYIDNVLGVKKKAPKLRDLKPTEAMMEGYAAGDLIDLHEHKLEKDEVEA